MRKLVALLLISTQAFAGLPPTTSKVSGDSTDFVTFKYRFPNFTATRTGVITQLNINSVAGGGTGLGTLTANNILIGNGTSNVTFLAPSSNGNIILDNGTSFVSAAPPTSMSGSTNILNVGLSTSVSSNALTIELKQSDGSTDPTSGSPSYIGFRSSTATSGAYNQRSVTSSLSITIPSGTTIGTASNTQENIYVYAIDNAGTVELAVSVAAYTEQGATVNTTAISGGSTRTSVYSTTARSGVPIRLIGKLTITEGVAGTWASNATIVTISPFNYGALTNEDSSIYRYEVARASSACSSTPCTLSYKTSGITNVTRSTTGSYSANFPVGTFSSPPVCIVVNNTVNRVTYSGGNTTATTFPFQTGTTGGSNEDDAFSVFCVGPR